LETHSPSGLSVREFRGGIGEKSLEELGPGARLSWRDPLDPLSLARVAGWLAARPAASVRLHGRAVSKLPELAHALPEVLTIDAAGSNLLPPLRIGRVRSLEIAGMPDDLARVLDTFADVRALRLAARGEPLPPGALDGRELRVLDLSRVGAGPDLAALAGLTGLRSLRLYRLEGFTRLDGVERHGLLAELALAGLVGVDDLEPLARLPALAALELTGMWQLDLPAVSVLERLSRLSALSIDIGGRRKNVEVYRRLPLPRTGSFGRSGFAAA
jgi:hypothetical protein